jgi:hypothetical protein
MAMTAVHENAIAMAEIKKVQILFDKPMETESPETHTWIRCAKGHHEKEISWEKLSKYKSCGKCRYGTTIMTEDLRKLASERGGKCNSTSYTNHKANLSWECCFGHTWEASYNNVKNHGSWCPYCVVNIGEELSRVTLEDAFPSYSFLRTRRLPWLEGLELDGYCEGLSLAFEYQGKQHYERVAHFQRNEGDFEAQLERDRLTAQRCAENNVILLIIPYHIGYLNIRSFIHDELKKHADKLPEPAPITSENSKFFSRVRSDCSKNISQLEKAKRIAVEKGGICLSEIYVGYRVPLSFRCGLGHKFDATLEAIDQSAERGVRFCPECGIKKPKNDDEMRSKVEACGFKYFDTRIVTSGTRNRKYITVQCPNGHTYDVMWDNFCPKDNVPKKGCMSCRGVKIGGLKRIDIAAWSEKTGVVPITPYKTSTATYDWKCRNGHEFATTFNNMKTHTYDPCSTCDLRMFAASVGLTPEDELTPNITSTTLCRWRCDSCSNIFTASKMGIARKKDNPCPNCNQFPK